MNLQETENKIHKLYIKLSLLTGLHTREYTTSSKLQQICRLSKILDADIVVFKLKGYSIKQQTINELKSIKSFACQ